MRPTRKYHRKTKTGCIPCKNRHSKCDELKPRCSGCIRNQTTCVYPTTCEPRANSRPLLDVVEDDSSPASRASDSGAVASYPQASTFQLLNLTDLKNLQLLHHYTTETYSTVSCNRDHDQIWQKIVPSLAYHCPYLMHCILSIAALHLAYIHPEQASLYRLVAVRNQDLALPQYRAAVSTIGKENGQQIFAFSTLLMMSPIAPHSYTSSLRTILSPAANVETKPAEPSNAAEWIFDWMRILRGIAPIVFTLGTSVYESPLGPLIQDYYSIANINDFGSNPVDFRLEALLDLIKPPGIDAEDLDACRASITELRRIFAISLLPSEQKRMNSLAFSWPVTIHQRFFALLEARKPEAIIILSYYAVFLLKIDFLWWMQGAAVRFVDHCKRSLEAQDATWALSWIEWPIKFIDSHNHRDRSVFTQKNHMN